LRRRRRYRGEAVLGRSSRRRASCSGPLGSLLVLLRGSSAAAAAYRRAGFANLVPSIV
jgi:hypothetical protein